MRREEANPYYFFNSIIIPGEWRGTQAFHFPDPTSWKSAMNLDTVADGRVSGTGRKSAGQWWCHGGTRSIVTPSFTYEAYSTNFRIRFDRNLVGHLQHPVRITYLIHCKKWRDWRKTFYILRIYQKCDSCPASVSVCVSRTHLPVELVVDFWAPKLLICPGS